MGLSAVQPSLARRRVILDGTGEPPVAALCFFYFALTFPLCFLISYLLLTLKPAPINSSLQMHKSLPQVAFPRTTIL